MLIFHLKCLFATNRTSSDNISRKYYHESDGINLLKDHMIKQEFEIRDNINPAEEQHERIQKKYHEEIELLEDDPIKLCIRIEKNIDQVEKRDEQSWIRHFLYQKYDQLKKFIQKIGFYTIGQLYVHLGYRRIMDTHPYMKYEFNNVLKYKETLNFLYFPVRHEEFANFAAPFTRFCDILEKEEEKTDEKSTELEEHRKKIKEYIKKFHIKVDSKIE